MSLVLDSSATLAWALEDEATDAIRSVFDAVADEGAFVPSLWRLEVANALAVAVRRRRIDYAFRQSVLADLTELEIFVDNQTDARAWNSILDLADARGLTVYDAAYIELALRRPLPLASLDGETRRAARQLGLRVLPLE